jgi:dTDP-4-dehydrorhamnose reductase
VARLCDHRALAHVALDTGDLDITDGRAVNEALETTRPWAVVNAATGHENADMAEAEPFLCLRRNAKGAATLADACALRNVRLLLFSSDLVFDGAKGDSGAPYVESDAPAPLGVLGRSLASAEAQALARAPKNTLVVRTTGDLLYSPWDPNDPVSTILHDLASGRRPVVAAPGDLTVSPTYLPDLVHACLDLLIDGESGVWHLTNGGAATWADFLRMAAVRAGLDPARIEARPARTLLAAPRPAYAVLGSERGAALLPPIEVGLDRYFRDRPANLAPAREQRPVLKTVAIGRRKAANSSSAA